MTAHVFFPAFEKQADLPATLSKSVLTGLLREELNFSGLLITDDLEMGAITEKYGISDAASRSFLAGADQLLICHSLEQQELAAGNILALVKKNKEYQSRLETSLERIDIARKAIAATAPEQSLQTLRQAHEPLVIATHKKSLRCLEISDSFKQIPSQEPVLFLYPKISALVQVEESHQQTGFAQLISSEFSQALTLEYDPKATADDILSAVKNLPNSKAVNKVIFFSYNLHLFPGQSFAAKALAEDYSESALIALRNPYDLVGMKIFSTRIATFSFRTPAIKEVLKALRGKNQIAKQPWPVKTANW
jgi:beta-N-acetylhexosaminidase